MGKQLQQFLVIIFIYAAISVSTACVAGCARSIFVPRQISYNPIFENALTLAQKNESDSDWSFSVKPIYTQNVGDKFKKYFNIDHQQCLNVQENGSGDIGSLWFGLQAENNAMFSSTLSFCPVRQTYGGLIAFSVNLPCDYTLAINSAIVSAKNNMHIHETDIKNPGVNVGFGNMTQAFANQNKLFGRICGDHTKTGVDDIQVKLIKTIFDNDCWVVDGYLLLGIPTGKGTKSRFVFEPLVGSKHAQLGLGGNATTTISEYNCGKLTFLSELKWRYGLSGNECRSFDLKKNGQWSRYLLLVNQDDKYARFPAINNLTFYTDVTPRNSVDLYLAAHANHNQWQFELGYDFWYRQAEKVCLRPSSNFPMGVGIADLPGITLLSPQSASTANISQGTLTPNQITSDATFVPVTLSDVKVRSGAAPRTISNSFYGSIAYAGELYCHPAQCGLSVAYEQGSGVNTPNNVAVWINFDWYF